MQHTSTYLHGQPLPCMGVAVVSKLSQSVLEEKGLVSCSTNHPPVDQENH